MDLINIIFLIAVIGFTLIFFRLAKLFGQRNRLIQRYIPLLSALELTTWTVIIFWAVNIFFSDKLYYPYLIIILVMAFSLMVVWYYLKDVVAGFLFRVRHNPQKGQILQNEKMKGTIRLIGLSQITIETIDGQWYRMPYSTMITQPISLKTHRILAPGETVVKLKLQEKVDPGHFESSVRQSLAMSSWCVASKPITIQNDLTEEGVIKISFFMLDSAYLSLAKDRLAKLAETLQDKKPSTK